MDSAFEYVISKDGLCSESNYPYKGVGGSCKSCTPVSTIKKYVDVAANKETALEAAVAQQPVSVAIEADRLGFQFYRSGVFSGSCGTNLDHGVLAVGYGTESGKDYWLVKNWKPAYASISRIRTGFNSSGMSSQAGITS